jgi:hypothetical protein
MIRKREEGKRKDWAEYFWKAAGTVIYRKTVPKKSTQRRKKDSEAGTAGQTSAMRQYRQSSEEEEQFW